MATYYELDNCTNCKQNQWRLGRRDPQTGKTEFFCFDCSGVVHIRTTREGYLHLAGGDA